MVLATHPAPARPDAARPLGGPIARLSARDTAIDLARAACLVIVVALHAMMVGVSSSGGVPVFENAMESWAWFPPVTWIVQVMPLFFVLGGFSSFTDWSRRRQAGGSAGAYVLQRMRRLVVPASIAIAATGVFLAALTLAGVAPEFVAEAGFRSSQPLWFLGVYILCTAFVPAAAAAHRRAPVVSAVALALVVVGVDAARSATGIEAIGFANLLFVWLLLQQLGFFLADGSVSRWSRRTIGVTAVVVVGALLAVVGTGFWSGDLFHALNPPTGALVLLGVVQLCVFELLRPGLRALHGRPLVRGAVDAIGSRAMTIYSWHMPVLIAMAGGLLLLPGELDAPLSDAWWQSRPVWLLAAAVLIGLVVAAAGRVERRRARSGSRRPATMRVVLVSAIAAAAVLAILASGGSLAGWLIGSAGLAVALRAARGRVSARAARERGR